MTILIVAQLATLAWVAFQQRRIMATLADVQKVNADLKREVAQILALVAEKSASLQAALDKITELITSNADNADFRAGVEALLPDFQQDVTDLDALTPEPGV